MIGRIIVLNSYTLNEYRLHVYGCAVSELSNEDYENVRIRNKTVGILVETRNDFEYEQQLFYYENDSYQIRPKALYKNKHGLFYTMNGRQVFLSREQEQDVYDHIEYWKTLDWEGLV